MSMYQSFVYNNEDYSNFTANLETTGLNYTFSSIPTPSTLFAPINEAYATYLIGSNTTIEDAIVGPYLLAGGQLDIIPGQFYS